MDGLRRGYVLLLGGASEDSRAREREVGVYTSISRVSSISFDIGGPSQVFQRRFRLASVAKISNGLKIRISERNCGCSPWSVHKVEASNVRNEGWDFVDVQIAIVQESITLPLDGVQAGSASRGVSTLHLSPASLDPFRTDSQGVGAGCACCCQYGLSAAVETVMLFAANIARK